MAVVTVAVVTVVVVIVTVVTVGAVTAQVVTVEAVTVTVAAVTAAVVTATVVSLRAVTVIHAPMRLQPSMITMATREAAAHVNTGHVVTAAFCMTVLVVATVTMVTE